MKRRFNQLPACLPRPRGGGGKWRPLFGLGLLLGLSLVAEPAAQAQTGGPTPGGTTPTAIPLDGGASLLLVGGVGYALRRLRRKPKS